MNAAKIVGVVLIVAGTLGLVYGGFSYTKENEARIGPIELTVENEEKVSVPIWLSVGAIAIGGVLLLMGGNKR